MILPQELNPHNYSVNNEQAGNLADLLFKLNIVRREWGQPMIVTSGLRTWDDQLRIYQEKAAKAGIPFDEAQVPKESKHLVGAAADISDPNGDLYHWATERTARLKQIGLWCELGTKGWIHFQCLPPASGNTWFLP